MSCDMRLNEQVAAITKLICTEARMFIHVCCMPGLCTVEGLFRDSTTTILVKDINVLFIALQPQPRVPIPEDQV